MKCYFLSLSIFLITIIILPNLLNGKANPKSTKSLKKTKRKNKK